MRRVALLAVLVCLASPPAALAQSDPFGPLPPAAPTVTPTPEPLDELDDGDVGRNTLYAIGGLLLVAFAGLAVWITRDARRAVPQAPVRTVAEDPERDERARAQARRVKARARKKARTARASRRRNR